MNIAIFYGGKSVEHEVSCVSAKFLQKQLKALGHEVFSIKIDQSGVFHLSEPVNGEQRKEKNSIKLPLHIQPGIGIFHGAEKLPIDCIFPVTHGTFGEDGCIQGLCELLPIPYAGCGVAASAIAMNKVLTKQIWSNHGLPIAPWGVISREDYLHGTGKEKELFILLGPSVFIKPASGGSSIGVTPVKDITALSQTLDLAFLYDHTVIIEKTIHGRELECAVLGTQQLMVSLPGEICSEDNFYAYTTKYSQESTLKTRIPPNLPASIIQEIQELAKKGYQALGGEGFSRVDLFYDEANNKIYLNEMNTLPGLTPTSLFGPLCEASGVYWPEVIAIILQDAQKRFTEKQKLSYSKQSYDDSIKTCDDIFLKKDLRFG